MSPGRRSTRASQRPATWPLPTASTSRPIVNRWSAAAITRICGCASAPVAGDSRTTSPCRNRDGGIAALATLFAVHGFAERNVMKRTLALLLALAFAVCVAPAQAAFHLFRIDQVYSNADGTVQYVVMREVTGSDGEGFWQGNLLTTTGAASGLVAPDYTVPDHFLPTTGGTLNYASGVEQIVLPALPSDGATAIDGNG